MISNRSTRQWRAGAWAGLGFFLALRWLAWLLALAQSGLGLPPTATSRFPWLALAALYNAGLTVWLLSRAAPRHRRILPGVLSADLVLLLALTLTTGGWHSPFYRTALSAFFLPPYLFGRRGTGLSSLALLAWHALLADGRDVSTSVLLTTTLDALLSGATIILAGYAFGLAEARQRRLAAQAAEQARLRMARHLHDETLQQVYGLILAVKSALVRLDPSSERARIQTALDQAVQTWEELRSFLQDLRRPAGEAGLEASLRHRAGEFTRLTGLPVHVEFAGPEPALAAEARARLLAIVRAALSNVYRHARATTVSLRVRLDAGELLLAIEDDGIGFAPEQVSPAQGQFGLAGIHERAAALGGRLTVESRPGHGTRLCLCVPLARLLADEEDEWA